MQTNEQARAMEVWRDACTAFAVETAKTYGEPDAAGLRDQAATHVIAADRAALRQQLAEPIDMLLFCPKCGVQHVDEPGGEWAGEAWTNPPHKSHLCLACGCIWRPADKPTNGVASLTTTGKADTWKLGDAPALAERDAEHRARMESVNNRAMAWRDEASHMRGLFAQLACDADACEVARDYARKGMAGDGDAISGICCKLSDALAERDAEVKALREALEEIRDPLSAIQSRAQAEGAQIDGVMANVLARDPGYLQSIAARALLSNRSTDNG